MGFCHHFSPNIVSLFKKLNLGCTTRSQTTIVTSSSTFDHFHTWLQLHWPKYFTRQARREKQTENPWVLSAAGWFVPHAASSLSVCSIKGERLGISCEPVCPEVVDFDVQQALVCPAEEGWGVCVLEAVAVCLCVLMNTSILLIPPEASSRKEEHPSPASRTGGQQHNKQRQRRNSQVMIVINPVGN